MSLLGNIWVKLGLKSDDFNKGIDAAEKKTSKFSAAMKGVAARVLSVAAALKVLLSSAKIIADFEAAQSRLASILGTSVEKIGDLTKSARDLGSKTQYTASQVTELQTELAKLGFTAKEITDMQEGVLKFAAAVGTDLASAAARAGATMRGFNLSASETNDMLAVMAVSTSKSALSFSYLDSTLGKLIPVTKAVGLDTRATIALLGTLANAGIDASSASTALRRVMGEVGNSSSKLNRKLGKQPKTMEDLVEGLTKLKDGGMGVTEAFDLVGKYAGPAFLALVNGADSCRELYGELQNTNGALDEMYRTMTDNVKGSVDKLKSAWQDFVISLSASKGPIKWVIDRLTDLVTLVNKGVTGFKSDKIDKRVGDRMLEWRDLGLTKEDMAEEVEYREARLRAAKERGASKREIKKLAEDVVIAYNAMKDLTKEMDSVVSSTGGAGSGREEENEALDELLKKMGQEKGYRKDSIGWLQKQIEKKQELRKESTDVKEIQTLNTEIDLLQKKVALLQNAKELSALPELSAPTGKAIATGNGGIKADLKHTEEEVDEFLAKLRKQQEQAEDIADGFASALQNGIVSALDELANAIGTGDWDTGAMLKALVTPLADMAISAGVIISGVGEAVEALKTSLTSLQGPIAIAAGAALIAAGVAAKAGLAALAKKGGSGSSASGGSSNPYTYTGGYGVTPAAAGYGGQIELGGTVTVKGQDIQIALDNYNKNRKR
jgi:TP901 family phage tail tape measure protein